MKQKITGVRTKVLKYVYTEDIYKTCKDKTIQDELVHDFIWDHVVNHSLMDAEENPIFEVPISKYYLLNEIREWLSRECEDEDKTDKNLKYMNKEVYRIFHLAKFKRAVKNGKISVCEEILK